MSGKLSVLTLAFFLVACSQGRALHAPPSKAQAPTPASAPTKTTEELTALMPQPRSVEHGAGWLHVTDGFGVEWAGYRSPVLDRAVVRFQNDVARRTGFDVARAGTAKLRIDCRGDDAGLAPGEDEHYVLVIRDGAAVLTADAPIGVLRGLATLRQSITNVPEGFAIPAMTIDDSPRFAWRGLMIDVARHFMSLPTLERQIDTMELVKLNVLHLHLSDIDRFRVESHLDPKLNASSHAFYSQADIRALVAYAADRGVRIVPEFDVPGHSLATLDPLFSEMAGLFPDPYFHVGAFDRVRNSVPARGKTVIGWEEVAGTAIPEDAVVQTWRSSGAIARLTAQGNRVIATCGYDLDDLMPAESLYRIDPLDPGSCGLTHEQLEVAQTKGLPEALVARDAIIDPSLRLSPVQQSLVLGGEAALWTGRVTEDMLDNRLWPGAEVLAERFWSPASVRDTADMYRRLVVVHDELRIAGLADDANRRRIAARLAPGRSEPVALLLDLVSPVRNHADSHPALAHVEGSARPPHELNELADAASPDSLTARRFALDAERFVHGDRSGVATLVAELGTWRDNHDRFVAVARGNPQLEPAVPISADIAALSALGLDAIATIEGGQTVSTEWPVRAKEILDRQSAAEKASENTVQAFTAQQPPADLLIDIAPGVRTLVEAVASR